MDELWRTAPTPAVRIVVEAGACRIALNPAADDWGRHVGLVDADWQALSTLAWVQVGPGADEEGTLPADATAALPADAPSGNGPVDLDLPLGTLPRGVACRRVAWQGGWLLWLMPDATPLSRWVSPTEQITLMQEIGRMGVVVRDMATDQGFWDAQVYRMMGMAPAAGAPALEEALARVHPDDLALLQHSNRELRQGRGRVSLRFRVVWPDGRVRYLKSSSELRRHAGAQGELAVTLLVDDTELVDRDQQQRQANDLLGQALSLAGISVWEVDPEQKNIRFIAQSARILDRLPEPGSTALSQMRDAVHPDDLQSMRRSAEEALAGHHVVDTVTRFRDGQGGWKHLLTRRVAQRDAQGGVRALLGVALDLSELVKQRELSLSLLSRMELAADTLGVGFWSRDVQSDTVEWDARMYQLYARPPAAGAPPLAEWLASHVHPDDAARMSRRANARWDHRSPAVQDTFRIRLPDGSERWVQGWTRRLLREGHTVDFGLHMDVTERRQAELRTERERDRDRFAIESAGIGVWERAFDGRPSYWSPTMYRLRGLMPGDPRPLQDLVELTARPGDVEEADRRMARCIELGETYRHEFVVIWADGTERWLASTGRAVRDASGQVVALAGVNVDITERHLAGALTRERDRAEQASAAKSGLMARVSHELRTPMNAVLGFAELMAQDSLAPLMPRQAERLDQIRSAGHHLLGLIDDLLELSRAEAGGRPIELEPVALDELLHESLQWVGGLARQQGVRVEADEWGPGHGDAGEGGVGAQAPLVAGPGSWPRPQGLPGVVMADRRRLGQVMVNLLTNGIKYNRVGGRVQIGVRVAELEGAAAWELCVSDDGRGLSSEQIGRLFEPFNRLGAEREGIPGTGIGLSIVQQLVQDMGGRLTVNSEAGRGSEFRVSLKRAVPAEPSVAVALAGGRPGAAGEATTLLPPAAPAFAAPPALPESPDANLAGPAGSRGATPPLPVSSQVPPRVPLQAPPLRVVYVEDNPVNEMLVREMLSLRPHVQLETAPDGLSGIAQVMALRPEVVLLDLQLPDISGLEVLRRLRGEAVLAGSSFVALSANAMPDDVRHALEQGFDDYWTKPLDLLRFLAAIDALALQHGRASLDASTAAPPPAKAQGARRSRTQAPPSSR